MLRRTNLEVGCIRDGGQVCKRGAVVHLVENHNLVIWIVPDQPDGHMRCDEPSSPYKSGNTHASSAAAGPSSHSKYGLIYRPDIVGDYIGAGCNGKCWVLNELTAPVIKIAFGLYCAISAEVCSPTSPTVTDEASTTADYCPNYYLYTTYIYV
jgi:hypothetical protein